MKRLLFVSIFFMSSFVYSGEIDQKNNFKDIVLPSLGGFVFAATVMSIVDYFNIDAPINSNATTKAKAYSAGLYLTLGCALAAEIYLDSRSRNFMFSKNGDK